MEENLNQVKVFIVGLFAAITSFLGVLAIPVYILVSSNVIDYITAIIAAPSRGQKKSSAISFKGIKKKVSMWLLVYVGVLLDQLLIYTSTAIGIALPFNFLIACIVALWLCANEIISILENLNDILGEDMPSFLLPMVKNIRSQVEEKVNLKEVE
ncbi:holin [Romboutsia ilealis]|uniref:Phage holin family protein n=1 Tax=Romboutsia faecis TaxID=2764597 RepID=A0ABR7JTQ1_9FIRM|nr:phage holin family protein [Romboutsia faecis]MBC5998296.1 phage holin family protein [Romboutsia faecis]MRN25997.1 holin [Romboutsia ilealis]